MNNSPEFQPLAVIGMACRLPGADDLDAFWRLLRSGSSAIAELPADRFDRELYYNPAKGVRNKSYSALGGLVSRKPFDRAACPLAEQLIARADEAHLMLCEVAAAACRHAGFDPFDLPLRNAGVYVGHAAGSPLAARICYASGVPQVAQYLHEVEALAGLPTAERDALVREVVDRVRAENPLRSADLDVDLSAHAAAGLITQGFGLTGPFMAVDAACASSLQALKLGAAALAQGRIDMAIVGGASFFKSDSVVVFSHAQSLSAQGSRPFDAAADGLILSEGYVVLLVKTLARALADGDRIQTVIRSIGMSTDGKGKSLWAPRKEGQILSIQRAYAGNVDVSRLQYLEAHATSTQIGDATELQALAEALGGRLPAGQKIPIGSVKANIGHTLEAAGLAGLLKTVLAMRHAIIPPAVDCRRLNPEIDWERAPFFVPTTEMPWPVPADGGPRRAGVNSFGIGGLNSHVVIDEFQESKTAASFAALPAQRGGAVSVSAPDADAVACIGAGCILPGAKTIEAFWDLLVSGRDARTQLPADRWNAGCGIDPRTGRSFADGPPWGGFISDYAYDWKKHTLPPRQVAQANPLQFMLLDAADQAFRDAGFDHKPLDRSRVGVVVGTVFGDEFSQQLNMGLRLPEFQRTLSGVLAGHGVPPEQIRQIAERFADILLHHMPALIDETGSFTSSTLASRITKSFDLFGGALALDAGAASGLAAVAAGVDWLLDRSCDLIVCAAGQRDMSMLAFEAYAAAGLLADGAPGSPFDAAGHGHVPGEGVGVVLLKRLADARRDGDRIRAVIRGVGAAAGDEIHKTARLAMSRAGRSAHVDAADVATVEIAGAVAASVDARHASAIAETYAPAARRQPLLLGSLTSQTGDLFATSGMAGFIKTSLALEHATFPPNVGLGASAPWLADRAGRVEASSSCVPLAAPGSGHLISAVTASAGDRLVFHVLLEQGNAMTTAQPTAFPTAASQGTATHEIVSPAVAHPAAAAAGQGAQAPWRIVRIGAGTLGELASRAEALRPDCGRLFAAADRSAFGPSDHWRLALVVDSASALEAKLSLAASQLANAENRGLLDEQGIHCRELAAGRPRVAFLFPGQGSQYPGMLRELIRDCPAAAAARQEVDAAMGLLGHPGFDAMTAGDDLGEDVWRTQAAMLLADVVMFRTLSSLDIRPDLISAHSYGEFPALVAAGAWSLEQAIAATWARARAIETSASGPGSQMLSVAAPLERVQQLVSSLGGATQDLYISHHNGPDQTVAAGLSAAVEQLAARARSEGFDTRPLAVPRPYHTPLMADAQAPFRKALAAAWITPPRVPVLSSVSGRKVAAAADIRENLVAQLTAPVHYVDLVGRMAADGVDIFVEVGPQQVLTRLNRRILAGRGLLITASDNPKRPGLEQLYRVQAQLECAGAIGERAADSATGRSNAGQKRHREPLAAEFVNFDATLRRKARLRSGATVQPAQATAPVLAPQASVRVAAPLATATGGGGNGAPHDTLRGYAGQNGSHPAATSAATAARFAPSQPTFAANGTAPAADLAVSASAVATAPRALKKAPPPAELETFLVAFVVEQTGYPPEIVKLDSDLESDLGIDSIKKAQLFSELREYFDITVTSDLRLDQFPTLRHVVNFLRAVPGKSDWLSSAPPAPPIARPAISADVTAPFLPPLAPSPIAAPPAPAWPPAAAPLTTLAPVAVSAALPAGAALTGLAPATAPPIAPAPAKTGRTKSPPSEQLESFLTNFVVEQTGYPPEIVKLDSDLESDLGIDSIKKAQLFSELREYFDITITADLRLDQFPTLRHVVNFLRAQMTASAPAAAAVQTPARESAAPGLRPAAVSPPAPPAAAAEPAERGTAGTKILTLAGSPAEMGRQHGAAYRTEIRAILRRVAELSEPLVEPVNELLAHPEAFFASEQLAELEGIAAGAGVHVGNILAHNLAQDAGLVRSAAQVVVRAAVNGSQGMLHALVEETNLPNHLAEVLSGLVQVRRPARGLAHAMLGQPGRFGGHSGLNECGISITCAPLVGRAAGLAAGRSASAIVQTVLQSAADLNGAVEIVRGLARAGSWGLCIGHHPSDRFCYLEFDGPELVTRCDVDRLASADHALLLEPVGEAVGQADLRWERLRESLAQASSPADVRAALASEGCSAHQAESAATDSDGTDATATACRQGSRRQTSIVIRPATAEIEWSTGLAANADRHPCATISLAKLLPLRAASSGEPIISATAAAPAAAVSEKPAVTRRFVLGMLAAPLPAETAPLAAGAVLILGDNPVARALERMWSSAGRTVTVLPASGGPDELGGQFQKIWAREPISHLVLATPHDAAAGAWREEAAWHARREAGLVGPVSLCQEWIARLVDTKLCSGATLTAVTALGGDFGLSAQVGAVESGGLTGLIKSLYLESLYENYKGIRFKALDFRTDASPAAIADAVGSELSAAAPDLEVGFVAGRRHVLRAVGQEAPAADARLAAPSGVWVVTGGGRGVTAAVAVALGRRYGVKLHLLGTSPAPAIDPAWRNLSPAELERLRGSIMREADRAGRSPHEAWQKIAKALEIDRTLTACAAAGASATYHACDVSDWRQLADTLAAIRQADGPIEGIVHGAAIIRDAHFLNKKLPNIRLTLAAKADATAALVELTRQDPLRHFIAFSSVSGRFGARGQSDYCLANDLVCKQVAWLRSERPECRSFGVHWHAWDEIGAAVRPEVKAALESIEFKLMPPAEGIAHLVREIEAGGPAGEVLFIDEPYIREHYPIEVLAPAAESAPPAAGDSAAPGVGTAAAQGPVGQTADQSARTSDLPLIDNVREFSPPERLLAELRLDPTADPFLLEHRLAGRPLMPGVIAIEAIAEAAKLLGGGEVVSFESLEIRNALSLKDDRPLTVQLAANQAAVGRYQCQLTSELPGGAARPHITGIVELAAARRQLSAEPIAEPPLGWFPMTYSDDGPIVHGPRLRCLQDVAVQYDGAFGRIVAPAVEELSGPRAGGDWVLPAAVLDACFVTCSAFAYVMFSKRVEIPLGIDRLQLGRKTRPGETCTLRVYFRGQDERSSRYDFVLTGEDGEGLLAATGFRSATLAPGAK